ncbi:MAG: DegT/DnrJ/EryC1/StrS family aminotransferase [Nautiliaceae bacterium]
MIYLSPPHMSGREIEYVKKAFESNYIAPVGEFIDRFEEMVKSYVKSKSALALCNATSSLHLALRVLGVKGSKVVVPTFTFIGSVNPILYEGNEPIFVDSDEFWHMDLNLLEETLKKERPKAIIAVHIYGQVADIENIKFLANKYGAILIEDAAEALGARYKDKFAGTFGEIGVYSFNGNKLLTTSSGGMMVSDNEDFIKKARHLSTQAKEDGFIEYVHKEVGFNYRMSNVLAAIGVGQMEVIDERIKRKREIFEIYKSELSNIANFMPELSNTFGTRWLTTLTFKELNPFEVIKKLKDNNIESRPLWKPMHTQPLFKNSKAYLNDKSEELFKKGICLPSGTSMSDEDVRRVCDVIKSV